MSYNHTFAYQNRQKWLDKKKADEDFDMINKKKDRKTLSKRLKAQQQAGRYVHVLDEEMFNNLCNMLKSTDSENNELAIEILFKSKMSNDHITYLIKEHLYDILYKVNYDGERMRIYANGSVGLGTSHPYYSHSLTISTP